ncbi:uncharacterized protein PHACADRAFT_257112 [Phanerochaete carnosa HHB-10118-sp]|uniref:Uncharacterized protein n=1 Tax=Phanerochaete carnosa (strain HHB-10118-sp) TaxID=650164 RepID=K5VWX1_PHACS|nr:uncharacterized protein PHACADRAFT_257112 [Phanerochaete carnosa HHB-10118-sp]EKM56063.1 hypothetical protein PHACADRAFT_257112 [Phanerochaete carnosa HHB-10118-sp]
MTAGTTSKGGRPLNKNTSGAWSAGTVILDMGRTSEGGRGVDVTAVRRPHPLISANTLFGDHVRR